MSHASTRPILGTDAYWAARRAAFAIIHDLELARAVLDREPQYLGTPVWGLDADGYPAAPTVTENLRQWKRVDHLMTDARANPVVIEILTAQNRLTLLDW